MADAPNARIALPEIYAGTIERCYTVWCRVREFAYGLKLTWIALVSVLFGNALFLTPQAQDLFLEVRGNPAEGIRFWLFFYLSVLLVWVLPIYVSARWLLWQFRDGQHTQSDRRPVADWARRLIPPVYAVACPLALLLGQTLALLNVPDLVDLTKIEDNIADHRANMAKHCGVPGGPCILAFGRFLGDGALWILRSEWGLGTEWMIVLLYACCFCYAIWHILGYRIKYIDNQRFQLLARVLWWIGTIATLPLTILLVLMFYGYLAVEAQNPHTVAHLALLPALSIVTAVVLWRLLKPEHLKQAPLLARWLLGRPRAAVDETLAMRLVLNPTYAVLIGFAALATFVLLFLSPLYVTSFISRVHLVPFLLGPLVPSLTYLSHWSARMQAPLVVAFLLLVGIANSLVPDRHAVRTVAVPADTQRQSLDLSVLQWTATNGCDIARPESCPSPIIIAAAGGASRAGFLVGSLIGKLVDERTTLAALGPNLGQPSRPLRPFETQLFAISAVSGGSLGAVMSYAALADRKTPPDWPASPTAKLAPPCRPQQSAGFAEWYGSSPSETQPAPPYESWQSCLGLLLAGDFLSPVFVKLMGTDLVGLGMSTSDRAVTLEEAWEHRYAEITGNNTLSRGISQVRAEAAARGQWLPILLLNGTSVEAGRRIITSDIEMTDRFGAPSRSQPTHQQRPFVDARDLHEMLAQPGAPTRSRLTLPPSLDLALSTGATMSARFPFISPHGSIRAPDGTILDRVVDGGYYENFGASTALELARVLKTRYRLTPTVILVNNEPTTDPMDCVTDETQVSPAARPSQRFWFSTITSPLDAVSRTRIARGSHAAVELCSYVRSPAVGGSFAFITVRKSGDKPLSMSWWLSKHVQQYLALHLAPDDAGTEDASNRDQQFRSVNQKAFREIVRQRVLPGG